MFFNRLKSDLSETFSFKVQDGTFAVDKIIKKA